MSNGAPPAFLSYDRLERYLSKNADEIEHYITKGLTLNQAIDQLHSPDARPICIVCGEVIIRASRTAVFCRRYETCRKYSRRYTYLYQTKKLTKAEALATVFAELT